MSHRHRELFNGSSTSDSLDAVVMFVCASAENYLLLIISRLSRDYVTFIMVLPLHRIRLISRRNFACVCSLSSHTRLI